MEHKPNLSQIRLGFESEDGQEQAYVTAFCTCGNENCFWSGGTILLRYDPDGNSA